MSPSEEPMWKLIGSPSDSHASQKGSQSGWLNSGMPESWGFEHITMPFMPRAAQRWISSTDPAMSHHGTRIIGRSRSPEEACSSAIASL